MASPNEQTYLDQIPQRGRDILAALMKLGQSKQSLADKLGISKIALNYKIKDPERFSISQLETINKIVSKSKKK